MLVIKLSMTILMKYLWKRRSSVSSGWNEVIITLPCRAATITPASFSGQSKIFMHQTLQKSELEHNYLWLSPLQFILLLLFISIVWSYILPLQAISTPDGRGKVAKILIWSLQSSETIPGARMKIPWKVSSSLLGSFASFFVSCVQVSIQSNHIPQ